jgi:hypothetical protein
MFAVVAAAVGDTLVSGFAAAGIIGATTGAARLRHSQTPPTIASSHQNCFLGRAIANLR